MVASKGAGAGRVELRDRVNGQRWEAALRALGEIALAAAAAPDPGQLASLAARHACDLLSASSAALYWWEPTEQGLIALADSDPVASQTGRILRHGTATMMAFEERQPVVIGDYQNWPAAAPGVVAAGVASIVAVPLLSGDEALGAFSVRSHRAHAFDDELVRLLKLFAAQTAPVLHTARLYVQAEQRRVVAEAFVDLGRAAIGTQRLTGTVQTLAARACQLTGADHGVVGLFNSAGRLVGVSEYGLQRPLPAGGLDLSEDGPILRMIRSEQTVVAHPYRDRGYSLPELPLAEREGTHTIVAVPLRDEYGLQGVLTIGWAADVEPLPSHLRLVEGLAGYAATLVAQKKAEVALAQSEARYRAIVETSQEGIATTDAAGRLTYVNARLCDMLGCVSSELLGRFETDLLAMQPQRRLRGPIRALLAEGQNQADFALSRKDGTEVWVSVSTGVLAQSDGSAGGITTFTDITHRKVVEDRLRTQAFFDALTGLPNRALFEDRLWQSILAARRTLTALGLLFIDLDRFKEVNDTLGHEAGDDVLRMAGKRMQEIVRESDTVARFGGDEFAILLGAISGAKDASTAAERVRKALAAPYMVANQSTFVGASVGMAVYPADGDDIASLLRAADRAMYQVKRESHS